MNISLDAVTAVVSTTQVAVEAFVAQENEPAGAAEQDTTDGLAAVPAAEQFVVLASSGSVTVPVKVGEASVAQEDDVIVPDVVIGPPPRHPDTATLVTVPLPPPPPPPPALAEAIEVIMLATTVPLEYEETLARKPV